jgi:hypothetical protein
LKARPEPTQSEHLSDTSLLGKLLMLSQNVRLDWKVIANYKHSSLFGLVISDKDESFITLTPGLLRKRRKKDRKCSRGLTPRSQAWARRKATTWDLTQNPFFLFFETPAGKVRIFVSFKHCRSCREDYYVETSYDVLSNDAFLNDV